MRCRLRLYHEVLQAQQLAGRSYRQDPNMWKCNKVLNLKPSEPKRHSLARRGTWQPDHPVRSHEERVEATGGFGVETLGVNLEY